MKGPPGRVLEDAEGEWPSVGEERLSGMPDNVRPAFVASSTTPTTGERRTVWPIVEGQLGEGPNRLDEGRLVGIRVIVGLGPPTYANCGTHVGEAIASGVVSA